MRSSWLGGFLPMLTTLLSLPQQTHAKAVFAHFMIANAKNYTLSDWTSDITLAKSSSIDAFALNAGFNQKHLHTSFQNAFSAAEDLDFKLFFSLDYSGDGHWPKDQVITLLKNYTTHPAYFKHDGGNTGNGEGKGKALVSTFEGFQSANDWAEIKKSVSNSTAGECCIFIPDWTSVGPRKAAAVPAIDGLMSWDAWPAGSNRINTTEDEEYMSILDGRPYIMPVSPWFYTNLRQFDKNWVWQGDSLWYERWQQVIELQPEYVEILTWNDYGESHYIGPLRDNAIGILKDAGAPFDYVQGMEHDGWRALLPFVIQQYKEGESSDAIDEEVLTVWYRLSPAHACGGGKTTGNTESQHQKLMSPGEVLKDKIFYSALLDGEADVAVSIGGVNRSASWTDVPDGGSGVYHGSVDFGDRTGEVVVTLSREGEFLAEMKGKSIEDSCPGNLTNWNAWVGNATAVKSDIVHSGFLVVG
ncbi:glycoside hydrolase [Aspergillus karnatakaensis]|uniref:glycoside hydrolase family 71 protein n=1 Tax=Aspergillus karnatakaensis TaxID=1810916 RepID=UPI003CCD9F23